VGHSGGEHSWERRVGRRTLSARIVLQVAAIAIVAIVAWRQRHLFTGFGSIMTRLTWYWVALAFVAELASIPPLAEAQLIVLRAGGTRPDRWRMNLVTLASNAVSMSIPAGVAVAEGYTYSRYRRLGASAAVAAWAELASGALSFAALAAMALAGAVVAGGPAGRVLLPLLSVVVAGSFAAAALFRHPHILIDAVDWIERHVGRHLGPLVARTARRTREMSRQLTFAHPTIRTWMAAFWLSAVNWLLDVVCLALSFQAVGGPIPWGVVLLAFAGSKVVSSIGITPGGLGVVEGGLVAMFVAYGTNGPTAVASVLVYRALTFIGLVGIGWAAVALLSVQTSVRAPVGEADDEGGISGYVDRGANQQPR
jgi:uncharacterized protein (TIRG00374 family)